MTQLPTTHEPATVFDITTRIVTTDHADHDNDRGVRVFLDPPPAESTDSSPTLMVDLTDVFDADTSANEIAATAIANWIDTFLSVITGHCSNAAVDYLWSNIRARPVLLGALAGLAKWALLRAVRSTPVTRSTRNTEYGDFRSALQYFSLDSVASRHAMYHTMKILDNRDLDESGLMSR